MGLSLPPIPIRSRLVSQDGTMEQSWVSWLNALYQRVGQAIAPTNKELGSASNSQETRVTSLESSRTVDEARITALETGLPSYTVAGLPSATGKAGKMVYVSNETGGAVPAFSDGTNWRRVTDRAVVS